MNDKLEINNTNSNSGVLELESDWYRISVRWDGCIDYSKAGNVPFSINGQKLEDEDRLQSCDDYCHICDVDGMIELLQQVKELAKEHFGEDWK